ncbi:PhaM family polyhydroxyalkanoate granule multifunctional regulatory protein [Undibacterium sp. CY21W]|uniref:PhaM family polyhydroxyalkanoate granule multifunctional regulatory protein n=1 Tax=Undibacterium sp. CY21W TaxID=2762293 RepID=UPI00164A665E|nr:PhaM family polyhydroxyalkanoate granule multifunctional regulatory protein [Undibacterium sp. CY21W]MBC3928827.1 hypothetical protein [Undibacterium sp. CY21W]
MSNPFSGSDIPGMNSMGDPLGFIKKLWGSMNVPGMVAPPMSVDELDKKIQDLKTVESWLNVNMNMLRGTIQALEVQRATIATLQSLGENFAQHMQQASAQANAQASAAQTDIPKPGSSNASDHTSWPMPPAAAPAPAPEQESAPEPEPESIPPQAAETAEKTPGFASGNDAGTPFANPAAWWNLLQNQFKQAVSQAMEGDGLAKETLSKADATKPKTNARPRKSATASAKTAAKPTAKASASAATKSKNKTGVSSKTASKSTPKTATKTAAKTTTKTPQK